MNTNSILKAINYTVLLVSLILAFSLFQNIYQTTKAEERLESAQARLDILKVEQIKLKSELAEVLSQEYQEKQARDKLGLAKQGEIVLVLPEDEVLRTLSPRIEREQKLTLPDPNWKQWLNLFL